MLSCSVDEINFKTENGVELAENSVNESGARSGDVMKRVRSDERTKLAAQISLKGDATQTSLCSTKSILLNIKINYQFLMM